MYDSFMHSSVAQDEAGLQTIYALYCLNMEEQHRQAHREALLFQPHFAFLSSKRVVLWTTKALIFTLTDLDDSNIALRTR
jgi:hypothetical protein